MPLNIVIPMAGRGSRFVDSSVPKPFIEFKGQMMVEHVLEGLALPGARYILVIRDDFETAQAAQLARLRQRFPVSFVSVRQVTQGASCTALAAHELINDDTPVLFADSDNIFRPEDIRALVDKTAAAGLDGALLTVPANQPIYSYAETGPDGLVTRTREKEVISSHAIAGAYYFSRGRDFVSAAIEMLIYGDTQKGEYYMSNVYNFLIKRGKKAGIHEIAADRFDCVGTPEQLKTYLSR